jgi:Bacterial PH domain
VAFVEGWRQRYYARLADLMHRKMPPEEIEPPKVNQRRRLPHDELTVHEKTFHVSRQHWIVLVLPAVGLLSGLVLLTRPPGALGALVALLFGYVVYKRVPLREGWKERLISAVLGVVLVIVAPQLGGLGLVVAAALIAWPVYDVVDWWHEILVVTNKRVLLMHGVLTVHRPSVKIRSIGFSNCISGPIGEFLHYGTIDLDTPSQRDKALSNIEYVPHAYQVWRLILQMHSEHFSELGDHPREPDEWSPGVIPDQDPSDE